MKNIPRHTENKDQLFPWKLWLYYYIKKKNSYVYDAENFRNHVEVEDEKVPHLFPEINEMPFLLKMMRAIRHATSGNLLILSFLITAYNNMLKYQLCYNAVKWKKIEVFFRPIIWESNMINNLLNR